MTDFLLPPGYADLSPEEKARIVNGCGPGNWKLDLVPDELLGVDIEEPCNVHDYEYWLGKDRAQADARLHANILIACLAQHPHRLPLLIPLANAYFLAVHEGGASHFGRAA